MTTRKAPGNICVKTKSPLASGLDWRVWLVATLVRVISVPGIAEPDGSVTVPLMEPVKPWPNAAPASSAAIIGIPNDLKIDEFFINSSFSRQAYYNAPAYGKGGTTPRGNPKDLLYA